MSVSTSAPNSYERINTEAALKAVVSREEFIDAAR